MVKKKNWTEEKGLLLTIAVLSVVVLVLFNYVYGIPTSATNKQYSVKIIEITGDCEDCFNASALADALIKEDNLKVKSRKTLNYNSQESKEIIDKYNLKTIPALIILSKDIGKIGIDTQVFSIKDNYALFDKGVPYIDLKTDEVKGLVQLKEIQSDNCVECTPLLNLKEQFEKMGIKVGDYEIIGSSSEKGKEMIKKNELNFTSALLISKNIQEYWWIFNQLKGDLLEKQDYYLFKYPLPPYLNLENGKIKGRVDITFVENKSCEDCFDVDKLKASFEGLGVYFSSEKSVDVSSVTGKNLLNKYNITAIPTIILSKEIQDYSLIKGVLERVGTFEDDGKFVFRKLDSLKAKYQTIN